MMAIFFFFKFQERSHVVWFRLKNCGAAFLSSYFPTTMYHPRPTPARQINGHRTSSNNNGNPTPRTNGSRPHNASNSTSNSAHRSNTTRAPMSDATNHGPPDSDRGRSQFPSLSIHYDNSDAERSRSPTERRRGPDNAGAKRRQPGEHSPDQENGRDDHHAG